MSKRFILFCLLSNFLFWQCSDLEDLSGSSFDISPSNPSITTSTFGGSGNDSGQSVVATADGGYAILGFTQSNNGDIVDKIDDSFDYWVIKYDAQNLLEWQKTYGGSLDDRGKDIIQTQDGGFVVIGTSQSADGDLTENNGAQDFWIVKLNAQGSIVWQKTFGFSGNDNGLSVIQTSDLGYLLTGVLDVTASGGQGNTGRVAQRHAGGDYWAIKLNLSGELEWSRYFGGNFTDTPEGIVETLDGNFIIAGGSDSVDTDITNNKGSYDFWIIKIAPNGNLIWEKSFGGEEIDEAHGITKSDDGNLVIAGETRSNTTDVSGNNGAADIWLIKINTDGDLIWQKTLGGSNFDVARDIKKTQDNGFLLAGSSRSSDGDVTENKGQNDAWIVKVDNNGILQWEVSTGGSNIDFAYSVTELNDGTIVGIGDTTSSDGDIIENNGFSDLLHVRID